MLALIQTAHWTPEAYLHAINIAILLAGGGFGSWIGLKIKDAVSDVRMEQMESKEKLTAAQNEMRIDMNDKHAENKREIAVHVGEDAQQFKHISETLVRIETKVDRRNGEHTS